MRSGWVYVIAGSGMIGLGLLMYFAMVLAGSVQGLDREATGNLYDCILHVFPLVSMAVGIALFIAHFTLLQKKREAKEDAEAG